MALHRTRDIKLNTLKTSKLVQDLWWFQKLNGPGHAELAEKLKLNYMQLCKMYKGSWTPDRDTMTRIKAFMNWDK